MRFPIEFLLRISKATQPPDKEGRKMNIIIHRPYAHLEKEFLETFNGQNDVIIIVDRRGADQRTSTQPVETDRRLYDRRIPKEELVEVVI